MERDAIKTFYRLHFVFINFKSPLIIHGLLYNLAWLREILLIGKLLLYISLYASTKFL